MAYDPPHRGVIELHWDTDLNGKVAYHLYRLGEHGQLSLMSVFDQGPFDTALDVAQWCWRAVAKEVPPAST